MMNKKGVALVEYVFIIGLVVIAVIAVLALFGDTLLAFYQDIMDSINGVLP